MPVIAAQNFATGTQNYLNLGVDTYSRTLSIGSNWNRIRVGILCSISTVQETTYPLRTASFSIGVCSGVSSNVGVVTPQHVHGYAHGAPPSAGQTGGTFTYNAGTAGNSYYTTTTFIGHKTEAGVVATGTSGAFTASFPTSTGLNNALKRRGIYIADFSKSALVSGNLARYGTSGAASHMSLDITSSDLFSAIQQYTAAPVIQGISCVAASGAPSIAFNETTYGSLNTVYIYWGTYAVPLQLYEIAVWRVG